MAQATRPQLNLRPGTLGVRPPAVVAPQADVLAEMQDVGGLIRASSSSGPTPFARPPGAYSNVATAFPRAPGLRQPPAGKGSLANALRKIQVPAMRAMGRKPAASEATSSPESKEKQARVEQMHGYLAKIKSNKITPDASTLTEEDIEQAEKKVIKFSPGPKRLITAKAANASKFPAAFGARIRHNPKPSLAKAPSRMLKPKISVRERVSLEAPVENVEEQHEPAGSEASAAEVEDEVEDASGDAEEPVVVESQPQKRVIVPNLRGQASAWFAPSAKGKADQPQQPPALPKPKFGVNSASLAASPSGKPKDAPLPTLDKALRLPLASKASSKAPPAAAASWERMPLPVPAKAEGMVPLAVGLVSSKTTKSIEPPGSAKGGPPESSISRRQNARAVDASSGSRVQRPADVWRVSPAESSIAAAQQTAYGEEAVADEAVPRAAGAAVQTRSAEVSRSENDAVAVESGWAQESTWGAWPNQGVAEGITASSTPVAEAAGSNGAWGNASVPASVGVRVLSLGEQAAAAANDSAWSSPSWDPATQSTIARTSWQAQGATGSWSAPASGAASWVRNDQWNNLVEPQLQSDAALADAAQRTWLAAQVAESLDQLQAACGGNVGLAAVSAAASWPQASQTPAAEASQGTPQSGGDIAGDAWDSWDKWDEPAADASEPPAANSSEPPVAEPSQPPLKIDLTEDDDEPDPNEGTTTAAEVEKWQAGGNVASQSTSSWAAWNEKSSEGAQSWRPGQSGQNPGASFAPRLVMPPAQLGQPAQTSQTSQTAQGGPRLVLPPSEQALAPHVVPPRTDFHQPEKTAPALLQPRTTFPNQKRLLEIARSFAARANAASARGTITRPAQVSRIEPAAAPPATASSNSAASNAEAPLCPDCKHCMKWDSCDEGVYAAGWFCNNVNTCGIRGNAGTLRWFCARCSNDFCRTCATLKTPGQEQAATKPNEQEKQQEASPKPSEPVPKLAEPAPKLVEPAPKLAEPAPKPPESATRPAEPVSKTAEPAPKPPAAPKTGDELVIYHVPSELELRLRALKKPLLAMADVSDVRVDKEAAAAHCSVSVMGSPLALDAVQDKIYAQFQGRAAVSLYFAGGAAPEDKTSVVIVQGLQDVLGHGGAAVALAAFGKVLKWQRLPRTESGERAARCSFESAQDAWRACRLLHERRVADHVVQAQVEETSRPAVDAWRAKRAAQLRQDLGELDDHDVDSVLEKEAASLLPRLEAKLSLVLVGGKAPPPPTLSPPPPAAPATSVPTQPSPSPAGVAAAAASTAPSPSIGAQEGASKLPAESTAPPPAASAPLADHGSSSSSQVPETEAAGGSADGAKRKRGLPRPLPRKASDPTERSRSRSPRVPRQATATSPAAQETPRQAVATSPAERETPQQATATSPAERETPQQAIVTCPEKRETPEGGERTGDGEPAQKKRRDDSYPDAACRGQEPINQPDAKADGEQKEPVQQPTASASGKDTPTASAPGKDAPTASTYGKDAPTVSTSGKDTPIASASGKDAPTVSASDKDTPTASASGKDAPTASASGKDTPTAPAPGKDTPTAAASGKDTDEDPYEAETVAAISAAVDAAAADAAGWDPYMV